PRVERRDCGRAAPESVRSADAPVGAGDNVGGWEGVMNKGVLLALASMAWSAACTTTGDAHDASTVHAKLNVTSDELQEGAPIPAAHACTDNQHLGTSPALAWSGVPEGTQSFAITAIDPDAHGFVHWAVTGISASATSVPSGASPGGAMPGAHE